MKIAMFTRFFNRRNGGIGQYSAELLKGMIAKGHEIDPVATTFRGITGYFYYSAVDILSRIPQDVDVYHALTPMEAIYLPKGKTVVTFHDLIPLLHPDIETWYMKGHFKTLKRCFSKLWFNVGIKKAAKANRIVCTSEQTKDEVVRYLKVPEEKIVITRLGISKDLKPLNIPHDNYRIGTLSWLDPRKRIDVLVRAFKKIEDPRAELLIGGDGIDKERLMRIAGDDKRITFLGFLPENQKVEFLSSLDVFVFPSLVEGYGIPIIEAMACGVPVVTLDDAIIPYEVKSRTCVVSQVELHEILVERSFSCDIGANIKFARLHDWNRTVELTEAVYKEIIEDE